MKELKGRYFLSCLIALITVWSLSGCGDDAADNTPVPFTRLVKDQYVQSTILSRPVKYTALLPEGYDESEDSYPVVYLLHGYGDDETAWYTSGGLQYYVDRYIAETVPMIYVMPEGYATYYVDKYNGNYPYMEMFVDELVPEIDAKFRTKKDKTQRAVMGYSMGGYGALILPVMHPDVFTISVPLSMSFRTDEQYVQESQGSFDNQWAPNFGPNKGASGTARLTEYFKERSPFHFFNTDDAEGFNSLKFFIDCGDDEESLSFTNDDMHAVMRDHDIAHEYRVRSGGHSFDYWKDSYPEALKFISHAVQGIEYPREPDPAAPGLPIGTSDYEQMTVAETTLNVLKPADYTTTTTEYPVLYLLHDTGSDDRTESVLKVFSLLRSAMNTGKISKSIIVEIPSGENVDHDLIQQVVAKVDESYRTKSDPENRVIMGNGNGGALAASIVGASELFSDCFLFGAQLPEEADAVSPAVFYYLDVTDEGAGYRGYHNLYVKVRNEGSEYEYRVRQGSESYQSFLNGLTESFSFLKESLNR